jgi:hypothetical protein
MLKAFQEPVTQLLSHTPSDQDFELRVTDLETAQPSQERIDFLLGLFPYGTRVQENHIRLLEVCGEEVAALGEQVLDARGIIIIHLAAKGLNEEKVRLPG